MRIAHRVYSFLIEAVVWCALVPCTVIQVARRRASWEDLDERLGKRALAVPRSPRIVVHAVSAGEAVAAGAFVEALAHERPDWLVVLTCGNRDARTIAASLQQRCRAVEAVTYLPWDRRRTVEWVRRLQPSAVAIVEPEIWPNLYRACAARRLPLFLLNAHLYPQDVPRYRFARWFFADVLRAAAWIGVQTINDRADFVEIGAPAERLEVTGSFKFDVRPSGDTPLASRVGAVRAAGCQILIGGSTYALEEQYLLLALGRLRSSFGELRLILAPRHVSRAVRIASTASRHGYRVVRGAPVAALPDEWDVLVVDRLGDLAPLYAVADVAFVGGSIVNRGGHNVLEPARAGAASIVGPHVHHIREIVAGLVAVDAVVQLRDESADTLVSALQQLLTNRIKRLAMAERARAYCEANSRAVDRSIEMVVREVERRLSSSRELTATARPPATSTTWQLDANGAES